ncbi:hypothetical protein FJTKL_04171 [Diaporthe vaccinii]|uniref:Uncharacterized protein n=1 Tax=Diaporthe vaccinii TaxID=105482 RepID=A0ABR4DU60_9PEZI
MDTTSPWDNSTTTATTASGKGSVEKTKRQIGQKDGPEGDNGHKGIAHSGAGRSTMTYKSYLERQDQKPADTWDQFSFCPGAAAYMISLCNRYYFSASSPIYPSLPHIHTACTTALPLTLKGSLRLNPHHVRSSKAL